jgi:glycerate 2-kinase
VKVLICPDSFTGTLSAAEAAAAMAEGWASVSPGDDLVLRPLSDGGPGFLDAIAAGRGGARHAVTVTGPLGGPVEADYLMTDDRTAWIESASAAGLNLVPDGERDPTRTTTQGVGELIAAALAGRATRIVVGVGGTGTCDGGAGLLAALDTSSEPSGGLSAGGAPLAALRAVDVTPARAAVEGITLEVATDVDVPLLGARGAARGFAPQKGASEQQVEQLEAAMTHWAAVLGRTADGRSAAVALGAGAGGGLGAALIRLGARRVPGIGTVMQAAGIADLITGVDLVITGEGSFDWQSLRGKVVAGVATAALEHAVPVLVLAGRVEVSRREWITAGVAAAFPTAAQAGETHRDGVARAAARAARTWSRS